MGGSGTGLTFAAVAIHLEVKPAKMAAVASRSSVLLHKCQSSRVSHQGPIRPKTLN